ncbi:hypothetical protein SAMN04515678_10420 [Roseivivax sediminis]|uniref:Uncharacterized protein n=1 Tax=Roseivivax sediminis TaxID=936889 RepID=A0A1I1VYS1_9RHOB|nr:hypothetical protein SAMN04515678_10420 [Roseivivax sediminis]
MAQVGAALWGAVRGGVRAASSGALAGRALQSGETSVRVDGPLIRHNFPLSPERV